MSKKRRTLSNYLSTKRKFFYPLITRITRIYVATSGRDRSQPVRFEKKGRRSRDLALPCFQIKNCPIVLLQPLQSKISEAKGGEVPKQQNFNILKQHCFANNVSPALGGVGGRSLIIIRYNLAIDLKQIPHHLKTLTIYLKQTPRHLKT